MFNFFTVDVPYHLLHRTHRRFALSLFYCQLLCAPASFSQRSLTSFGVLSDVNLGYRPSGLTVGMSRTASMEIVVLAPEQPALRLYEISDGLRISETSRLTTRQTYRYVVGADMNSDGKTDYVAISSDGQSVSILTRLSDNSLGEYTVSLSAPAQKCVVADLNNDRRNDILLFSRNSAGVEVFLGQPNSKLKAATVLFPEISASDLAVTDFNGDGIKDILLLNWLSNQLSVFSGISKLIYSEQVAVQFPFEPAEISITPVASDHTFRLVVTLPEANQMHVYSGNSLGDYRLIKNIELSSKPHGVQFAHVNNDDYLDIVTSTSRGIEVVLGISARLFTLPTTFGAARTIAAWTVADVNGDGRSDCVLLDYATRRMITLANADYAGKIEFPVEYCVGTSPKGLALGDFNANGREDIAVVNAESSSLSILLHNSRGRFSGAMSVSLPENPTYVKVVTSSPAKGTTLVTSHAPEEKIAVVNVATDNLRSTTLSVPTGSEPFVLLARQDLETLRFLVRYRNSKDRSILLSLFEQINPRQFLERGVRATLSTRITALTVNEGILPGAYELLFSTNDKTAKRTTVSLSGSEAGMEFTTTQPLFSFIDSTEATKFVLGRFVNSDGLHDVIVSLGAPRHELGVWYGKLATLTRDSIEWIRNAQPVSDDAIIVMDVNDDNATDIVWLDVLRRSVMVSYGTERHGFKPPVAVASAEGVYSIRIASQRERGAHDLVMSHPARGTISITMNPFIR